MSARPHRATILRRTAVVAVGITLWFVTQSLIGARPLPPGSDDAGIVLSAGDQLFRLTSGWHDALVAHPTLANALLIFSSAIIDVLALCLILASIFGSTLRPFLGIMILFGLRQICQATCALPPPTAMIWHDPGFPSLFVTYDVGNDFFFSGHTALAVFGACELMRRGGLWILVGVAVALFEATTVIVLRAHYTLDVFTGVLAALWVTGIAGYLAPRVDQQISPPGEA